MIGEEVLSSKPISLAEVKKILTERKKSVELKYEQDLALKYATNFAKITPAKTEKLINELMGLETMTEDLAIEIANVIPQDIEIMKLIPAKDSTTSSEDIEKAFEIVKKYI